MHIIFISGAIFIRLSNVNIDTGNSVIYNKVKESQYQFSGIIPGKFFEHLVMLSRREPITTCSKRLGLREQKIFNNIIGGILYGYCKMGAFP